MTRLTTAGWYSIRGDRAPAGRRVTSLRIRCASLIGITALVGVLIALVLPASADDLSDPRYAGLGGAYTAVVDGPFAGLANPAGVIDAPGVHGAIGTSFSGTWGFVLGASVATGVGPAAAWASDGTEVQGCFAFYILPQLKIGVGISSDAESDNERGLSFALGGQYYARPVHFGVSVRNLGAAIFGGTAPASGHLGVALDVLPGITVIGDIGIIPTGSEVAVGGEASFGYVDFRWGVAVHLSGGFIRAGLGVSGRLFGAKIALSGGLDGAEHRPFFSLGIQADIPAWW